MKSRTSRVAAALAGTALSLLMAAPSDALPLRHLTPGAAMPHGPLVLVQEGDEAAGDEQSPRERRRRERQQAQEQQDDAAPQAEQAEEAPRQRKRRERQQAEDQQQEAAPQPEQAEEAPRQRKRRERQEAGDQQQEAAPQPEQAEETPRKRRGRQQAQEQQQPEATPEPEQAAPQPEQAEETPRERRRRERQQADQQQQQQEAAPQPEQAAPQPEQAEETPRERKRRERQQADQQQQPQEEAAPQPEQATPQPEQAEETPRERRRRERQQADQQQQQEEAAPVPQQADQESDRERRRRERQQAEGQQPGQAPQGEAAELPPGEAPSAEGEQRDRSPEGERRRRERQEQAARDAGPPPADDRAAQEEVRPERVESVNEEEGSRRREVRSGEEDEPRRRERPSGADVVREIGDRLILRYDDQVLVESNDRPRLRRNARDVFVEDLPRERTRETVVRGDGTRVVTIRNRYGDVIRRSRITPDGREYVLNYVEEEDTDRVRDWRDPGLDLPPFRLDVPREDYILDAARAPSDEDYYEFLEQPPVEKVERLYSVDEVKRSARVRQKTRRVDLDTITFDFGSASIPETEINKLDGVASAMERLLKQNPAETFLIEGHTDAVGSDEANLALSDRRAEAVAEALTNVFEIPPENLATQGYGEQYLKVQTSGPERANRRVAIRRITPLVAPVASAN